MGFIGDGLGIETPREVEVCIILRGSLESCDEFCVGDIDFITDAVQVVDSSVRVCDRPARGVIDVQHGLACAVAVRAVRAARVALSGLCGALLVPAATDVVSDFCCFHGKVFRNIACFVCVC